jgi:uncharacterized protein YyaL (SSP411 family)
MSNRLSDALSPYLRQHAANPVAWQPWDAVALGEARRGQKPIFLSIGYSSCHWCHVMAHESFEDPEIADLLNRHFVCIKVDREERPDLDQIYMEAVQLMTRRGGWPLSVFLTPEGEPLFGGTYWPPRPRAGMPGFAQVIEAVAEAWRTQRPQLVEQAQQMTRALQQDCPSVEEPAEIDPHLVDAGISQLLSAFDPQHGGFGPAPKFPQPLAVRLLLRRWQKTGAEELLRAVTVTLDRMARGGIYDHLGGGFHRYSVDERWLTPHFEKMLYDNAQSARCYLEVWQATKTPAYAQVVRETLDYVLREMTDPQGGFFSAEDADSEGEEGKFYLWTPKEIEALLGPDAGPTFCRIYDVTEAGNFEGRNILHLARPLEIDAQLLGRDPEQLAAELSEGRQKLLAARAERARPSRDDKILVSWNGLMIDALARAGAALDEKRYTAAAEKAARYLLERFRDSQGRLLHCARHGRAIQLAFLDDYASLGNALLTLEETGVAGPWRETAARFAEQLQEHFADKKRGGFYFTSTEHEPLFARKRDFLDAATPSGNGLAALLFLRLSLLLENPEHHETALTTLRAAAPLLQQFPTSMCQSLLTMDEFIADS